MNIAMAAVATVALLLSLVVRADGTHDFLRISCIKERRFFEVEYRYIHANPADADEDYPPAKRWRAQWAKHGYFFLGDLDQTCVLPNSRYRVVAHREVPGTHECYAYPGVKFSLFLDDHPLIKDVSFGYSCPSGPAIARITIADGDRRGDGREGEICLEQDDVNSKPICAWLLEPFETTFRTPLDQARLIERATENAEFWK
jgi:hypothetical protein